MPKRYRTKKRKTRGKSKSKTRKYYKRKNSTKTKKRKIKQKGKGFLNTLKNAAKEELQNQTKDMVWNQDKMISDFKNETMRDKKCKDKQGQWIKPAPDGCPPIPCSQQPRKSKYCNGNTPSSQGKEKCREPKKKDFGFPEHTWFGSEFCQDIIYVHGDVIKPS